VGGGGHAVVVVDYLQTIPHLARNGRH
jgi:hypothetical protein